jgi:hypothetical protein
MYEEAASGAPIKAFVNIGGSTPNIGTDALILEVEPGLARIPGLPPSERRGMVFTMAERGVPVIHLLDVRGLAAAHGLPWDPRPLPEPGRGALYRRVRQQGWAFAAIGIFYIGAVAWIAVRGRRR